MMSMMLVGWTTSLISSSDWLIADRKYFLVGPAYPFMTLDGRIRKFNRCDLLEIVFEKVLNGLELISHKENKVVAAYI